METTDFGTLNYIVLASYLAGMLLIGLFFARRQENSEMLKSTGQGGGIKDFEWLDRLAQQAGMALEADIEMPANNRSLIWKKRTL